MIRVLVVDDSTTAREAISAMLGTAADVQVIGKATDGLEAVEMTAALKPDVIAMDINMPRMNGYEATQQIMAMTPTPIVVVTSVSQNEMVHQGLDMLLAGALEIVQKPSNLSNESFESIRAELVNKVRAVSQIKLSKAS
jgi:two-component system, chemotaxis family, protein-glutamate methylesterase/glutaminase